MAEKNVNIIRILFCCLLMALMFLPAEIQAQTVEARAVASSDSLPIGGRIKLQLLLKLPSGFEAQWPELSDTLSKQIEIVSMTAPETLPIDNKQNVLMRQELTITSFDTGWVNIPPVNISFAPPGDSMRFVASTNPLTIRVFLPDVDPNAPIKDIKGIEKQPITLAEILPWLIGALVLALALWLGIKYYLKRRNRPVQLAPIEVPAIPPHKLALEQLEQLRYDKLWQNGQVKEYYVRLSDIIRVYIEAQFPVNAVEMTTPEIMQGIRPLGINEEARIKLQSTLELADLVKFAKYKPGNLENELALNHAIDFVVESYATVAQAAENNQKEELA
ncbi:MAG: hypothetical protein IPM52_13100 [Bacteroidetes bacterium]|nr:hypothetical protein [Bacteroidota bacterium]